MKFFFTFLILIFSFVGTVYSHAKVPVDISFFITDLKYNRKDGVKICEIQHGTDSTFYGDRFSHGEPGIIAGNFYRTLLQYQRQFWATEFSFSEVQINNLLLSAPEWHIHSRIRFIEKDPFFRQLGNQPAEDPHNIQNYSGFLSARVARINHQDFAKKYPGIIVIDAASAPFWGDKYKMTQLFSRNETLATFKPKWNLYEKKYSPALAKKIIRDLPCDTFVIKPRGAYLGNGVIIVSQEDLDKTLKYILIRSQELEQDPDKSYHYWSIDRSDSFLVEEFIESDPIEVPHLDSQIYQPTMRVAFLMVYNNRQITTHFLGYYWLLPYYPLCKDVSLTEKHKAYCIVPYFCEVDPETQAEVEEQLKIALPLLYREMLQLEGI